MMHQKIEVASLPSLRDAGDAMEKIASDLDDIDALLFALANQNGDWEFNPKALRGVLLALDGVRSEAAKHGEALLAAAFVSRGSPPG